jgi:hypothetical protein
MKLHTINDFLFNGGGQLPANVDARAVAIHPSSVVDLVDVDGFRLGPGGIAPASPQMNVRAVRNSSGGFSKTGETLVLALYEPCDPLVPLGSRVPVFSRIVGQASALPDMVSTPVIAMRLPFHGRQHATFTFERSDTTVDLSIYVVGFRAGIAGDPTNGATQQRTAANVETWWNGGGAAPTDVNGQTCSRTIHVGGDESEECFDWIIIYARGAAGSGTYTITAEAWGERMSV